MTHILVVGLGGFIGAIVRFKISGLVLHHAANVKFPLGTFLVNVTGCLLIGIFGGVIERYHFPMPETRLFIMTGLLGGFTTFSAFGFETLFLIRRGDIATALAYVVLSLFAGIFAIWLGSRLGPGV